MPVIQSDQFVQRQKEEEMAAMASTCDFQGGVEAPIRFDVDNRSRISNTCWTSWGNRPLHILNQPVMKFKSPKNDAEIRAQMKEFVKGLDHSSAQDPLFAQKRDVKK